MGKRYTPSNLNGPSLSVAGMEKYLQKIEAAGNDIEGAAREAVEESAKVVQADIEAWIKKHKYTGATEAGLLKPDIKQDGYDIHTELGISTEQSDTAWHAVFVEYGTPQQPADPGIRNSFTDNKKEVRKIQRKILKKAGVPDG